MIDRKYDLSKPADIRALLQGPSWTRIMLSVCYWQNHCANAVGSYASQSREAGRKNDVHRAHHSSRQCEVYKERKLAYRATLKQLLDMHGFKIKYREMSGAVSAIERRPLKRGVPNVTPGSIVNLNQQALFVFSDLYTQEALVNLLIMSE